LSAGRAEMEEHLNRYKFNNPYYYRPWTDCSYT
jgi:hypothetical protein